MFSNFFSINYKISERFSNEKESGSLVVKENNGENVASDKTEIIKPIAMRSSFAIGVCHNLFQPFSPSQIQPSENVL